MRLRAKVFLVIVVVSVTLFFSVDFLFSRVIKTDFLALEKRELETNVSRVTDALQNKIDELAVKLGDWAQWDDTYGYMESGDEEYVESNLQNDTFGILNINFVLLVNNEGEVIFKKYVDGDEEKSFPEELVSHVVKDIRESMFWKENMHKGIMLLGDKAVIYAIRPVTSSDGTASSNGFISFASFLDEEMVADLARLTHLHIDVSLYEDTTNENFSLAKKHLSASQPFFVEYLSEATIGGYATVSDGYGNPIILVEVRTEREIYAKGEKSLLVSSRALVVMGVLFVATVLLLLEFLVVRKLVRLGGEIRKIRNEEDARGHLPVVGKDEFAVLAGEINEMLLSIRDAEAKRKESEARFKTVADAAPVMIWMSDVEKKCVYVNRVWLDFTGRSLEKELGLGWTAGVYPDDMKKIQQAYERAFEKQQAFHVEYRLRRADGKYAWVFARATPNFSTEGSFIGYIGSCIDITELKQAEEHQKEYLEQLEQMNKVMMTREMKIIELKEELAKLKNKNSDGADK